ncbi:MAG: plasmid recombination protein [Lachnospiraceae bacterium]|nr:plasmid recombination protein [Lachnospiraceae bacterium]
MAHVAKYTKSALGHMLNHYSRQENDGVKRGNQEIKPELTHMNWNVAEGLQPLPQIDFIHQRLSQVKVQNRADVNIMCDWVVTLPKDFPEDRKREFFQQSFQFLCNRYGKENVISAWVHEDETTPHMHFSFIPVTVNKKKGGFKVSAKEVLTRKDLQTFHSDLQNYLELALGIPVGILNQATIDGNQTIAELKRQTAMKKVADAERQLEQTQQDVTNAHQELDVINAQIDTAGQQLENILDKKARASEIHKISHLFDETVEYHKNMLSSTRAIGTEAYENMKKVNETLQQVAAKEVRLQKKEQEIAPLHEQAQAELEKATELRKNAERYIMQQAQTIADRKIKEMFGEVSDSRSKRLEKFCSEIKFSNGESVLDEFNEQERKLLRRKQNRE